MCRPGDVLVRTDQDHPVLADRTLAQPVTVEVPVPLALSDDHRLEFVTGLGCQFLGCPRPAPAGDPGGEGEAGGDVLGGLSATIVPDPGVREAQAGVGGFLVVQQRVLVSVPADRLR